MTRNDKALIENEYSGRQAYRYAERIAQYHRIQASPGYREAANQILQLLKRDGVEAELLSYPARFGERYLSLPTFKEWCCNSAELWIETPERRRIARFEEEEISLVQRSISTPKEGIVAEMVVIQNAEEESSYLGKDLKGKIALVQGNPSVINALAVEKFGAAGLIFENFNEYPPLRTKIDLPDARQYTSFWWHFEEESKAFGFVVSPRLAAELKDLSEKGKVLLKANVDAELYDGNFENIEYFIPGNKKEEVLITSHLCHPYPGGQDNASGPGTLMEVMRTLSRLIHNGELTTPDFGIRFLMMPEMTGTAAYFDQHPERIPLTVAALNLDMVGADQTRGGGPLCIEQPPLATPTFLDRYVYRIIEEIANNTKNFSRTTEYSTVHYVGTRFSGGSDHYIISDPTIGIPCPMLIQWPDRHYHTTADKPQNLDENMLKLVGTATALYAYGLANAEENHWVSYLLDHTGRSRKSMIEAKEWMLKQNMTEEDVRGSFSLFTNYELQAISQMQKYAVTRNFHGLRDLTNWASEMISKEITIIREIMEKELEISPRVFNQEIGSESWMKVIYERVYPGPVKMSDEMKRLPFAERFTWMKDFEATVPMGYADQVFYWMDGKRSVAEVLDLTKYETGLYFPKFVKELLATAERLGLLKQP